VALDLAANVGPALVHPRRRAVQHRPVDQARLLAVEFHHLVERVTAADVPLVLLAFPRMVDDADYLFRRMAAVLPGVTASQAAAAHTAVAEPARVRVGRSDDHGFEAADNAALRRELTRVREQLATSEANYAHVEAAYRDSQTKLAEAARAPRRWWRWQQRIIQVLQAHRAAT